MFENPIKKYQQGGQVSQEQQEMLAAFVEWLPKRVKEFQGMQPEQIVEALNGMSKTPEGQKQVQSLMQQFQQEIQNPQPGMFKAGGKLHDFICKHIKGGKVDCGCEEKGGKVEKHQQNETGRGVIAPMYDRSAVVNKLENLLHSISKQVPESEEYRFFNINGYPMKDASDTKQDYYYQRGMSSGKLWRMNKQTDGSGAVSPQYLQGQDSVKVAKLIEPYLKTMEEGGIVKAQDGVTLSRKEAIAAAENTYGFDKAIANRAYANAINGLRKQGVRGAELKQKAREMMFKMPEISDDITIEEPILEIPTFDKLDTSLNIQTVETPQPVKSVKQESVKTQSTQVEPKTIAKSWNYKPIKVEKYQIASSSNGTKPVEQQSVANQPVMEQPSVSIIEKVPVVKQPVDSISLTGFIEPSIVSSSFEKVATATNNNSSQPYWLSRNNERLVKEGEIAQRATERQPWLQRLFSRRNKQTVERSPVIGGTYAISDNPVEAYIKGAGLGIGTDVIFNNGQYVWAKTGQPVKVPTIRKNNGQVVPVVQKNGGVVKAQGGWKSSENDVIAKGILDQTNPNRGKNIDHITGIRSEQPLIDEHPGLDAALMYAQPTSMFKKPISRVLTKLMAPASYKNMVNGISNGEGAQAILYGLTPEGEWWEITKRAANLQQGNTKKYTHYKAVGEKETLPYKVAAKNRYRIERGVTPEGEPYRIVPNEINSEVAELRQERRNYWNENSGSGPAEWANSGSGSIKVRGKKIGGKIK